MDIHSYIKYTVHRGLPLYAVIPVALPSIVSIQANPRPYNGEVTSYYLFHMSDSRLQPCLGTIDITYDKLKETVNAPMAHESWHTALSSINEVYLIVDREGGRRYVGSAYGKGGLLERWTCYTKSLQGGNKLMKELLCGHSDHYTRFRFSVLQLLSKAATPDDAIQTETLWKKKLLTYEPFGMSQN